VLLSYLQSMVVLDLKGELFKATSGWRLAAVAGAGYPRVGAVRRNG
jgi:hypothetical protein